MSTTASRKAKARRLQNKVVELLLKYFPSFTDRDVKGVPMGVPGMDVQLSEHAAQKFPYAVECKNQESLNIWAALKQAESENREGLTPVVVFKRNRSEEYCALKLEDFMKLVGEYKE